MYKFLNKTNDQTQGQKKVKQTIIWNGGSNILDGYQYMGTMGTHLTTCEVKSQTSTTFLEKLMLLNLEFFFLILYTHLRYIKGEWIRGF